MNNTGHKADDTVPVPAADSNKKTKAKSDQLGLATNMIPNCANTREGAIYAEGAAKYGEDNWKAGLFDLRWKIERWEHAARHLHRALLKIKGLSPQQYGYPVEENGEDDLAKVRWFTGAMMWIEEEEARQIREKQQTVQQKIQAAEEEQTVWADNVWADKAAAEIKDRTSRIVAAGAQAGVAGRFKRRNSYYAQVEEVWRCCICDQLLIDGKHNCRPDSNS